MVNHIHTPTSKGARIFRAEGAERLQETEVVDDFKETALPDKTCQAHI